MALGTASTVYAAQTEEMTEAETEDALLYLYGSWIQGSSMSRKAAEAGGRSGAF